MICLECQKEVKNRKSLEGHIKKYHSLKLRQYELKHGLISNITCKGCSTSFIPQHHTEIFCTKDCRKQMVRRDQENERKNSGIENVNYVKCQICDFICNNLTNHLKYKHEKTVSDYKLEFPGHRIQSEEYVKSTSKNSGQFMKEDKYKKLYSERFKGDKNPNHKNNTTIEQRRSTSPFSIDFYKKKYPNLSIEEQKNMLIEKLKESRENTINSTQIEYWLNKGYDEIEARKKLKDRQTTFSLKICIDKHGIEEGTKIWEKRQEKWQNTMNSKSDAEKMEILKKKIFSDGKYSKISQNLFWKIYEHIEDRHNVFFKELNDELQLNHNDQNLFFLDFVYKNKVIEFQGDFWHANPKIYESNFFNTVRKLTANQIWKFDNYKNSCICEKYELLTVWEDDFRNNPEEVVVECLKFLNV